MDQQLLPTPSDYGRPPRHAETPTTPPTPPSESNVEDTPEVLDNSEMREGGEESEIELDPTALLL